MKLPAAFLFLAASVVQGGDLKLETIDLANLREGDPPPEIFVIDGSIQIKTREGRKVIEISGDKPEVDVAAVFGPSTNGTATIEARIVASKAGRSFPRFGIGVHGQTGFRLYIVPGRKELHLVKNDEVIKTAPFEWKSGLPVMLSLAFSPSGSEKWTVTGKVWAAGTPEPPGAQIIHETAAPPTRGQCSIWGTPYAGTPIDFDGIKVGIEG